ncbi:MAG: phosphoribosylamine--glycine ligase [Thermomicrobiales bacterium]|nr:phosphoribosylamine--glycine ligase [Thermomicrobiales bacterium]
MGYRVLVVGKGGREHAICWKLRQSSVVDALYCAPGNPGIEAIATCLPVGVMDTAGIVGAARDQAIDLVVVGPEDPLAAGLADALEAAGFLVAGPTQAAAQLEASKSFANDVMAIANIPTARSRTVATMAEGQAAIAELLTTAGVVVKADGLAAGKGVVVADTQDQALTALEEMLVGGSMGDAGHTIVIEERLVGEEVSILCLSDGTTIWPLQPSCDYKRAHDNDLGPNTGGMGNYTPTRLVDAAMMTRIQQEILDPVIAEMARRDTPMKGILFAGLMMTTDGPKVIEFNCRFGDPETQVVLPTLDGDLGVLLHAVASGNLAEQQRPAAAGAAVGVVLASEGYPGSYPKGEVISGLENAGKALVFHAGTAWAGDSVVTDGGRVLCVVGLGDDLATARSEAYAAAAEITFPGGWMRSDIALREI